MTPLLVLLLSFPPCNCYAGTGCSCTTWGCTADADCDGDVTISDLVHLLESWDVTGKDCCHGDSDCNGVRDTRDLLILLEELGEGCGS